jgi:hypothetical protein
LISTDFFLCPQEMRCKQFLHRNMPQLCHAVIVCQFCAMRGSLLSPNPMPTRDCCAVCGSIAPRSMRPMQAMFCQFHGNLTPFFADCITCGRTVHIQSSPANGMFEKLNLCTLCSSGMQGLTCCHLLDQP